MSTPVPAVLVIGDDPYLVAEAVSKALAGIDHLSVEDLSPQEDPPPRPQALESTSLFGGRRAVILRGVAEAPAEVQRGFIASLKAPNPDCLLGLPTPKPLNSDVLSRAWR